MWAFRLRGHGGIVSAALHCCGAAAAAECSPKRRDAPAPVPAVAAARTIGMATEVPYRRQVPRVVIPGPLDAGFPASQGDRREWLQSKLDIKVNYRRQEG